MYYYLCGSAKHLKIKAQDYEKKEFPDGEIYIRVLDNVKNKHVCVVTALRSSDDILETVFLVSALKRKLAKINLLVTYLGYARQDRIFKEGECLSFSVVGKILKSSTVEVSVIDAHNEKNNKKFLNFKDYSCLPMLAERFEDLKDVVVAPLNEGVFLQAKKFAKHLGCDIIKFTKRKLGDDFYLIVDDVENVKGKNVIVVGDIIDRGNVIPKTAEVLKKSKAKSISVVAVHGVFSGKSKKRVIRAPIKKVVVTNTLPLVKHGKIDVVSIEPFIRKNFSGCILC